jgi:hypothetical protein
LRCGVGQCALEVRKPGTSNGRTGHDDDVTRHKTIQERTDGLSQQPPSAVPDDGTADLFRYGEAYSRTFGRFPREMVQDELGTSHPRPFAEHPIDIACRSKAVLRAHDGCVRLNGEAPASAGTATLNDGTATRSPHPLAKSVAN